jgi:hypothetical protein
MADYPYEKKPAFFRILSPELFFEADVAASELESKMARLNDNLELDAELDAILRENELSIPAVVPVADKQ